MEKKSLLEIKNEKCALVLAQCTNAKVILMLSVVVCHCFAFWGGWFTNNPAIPSQTAHFIAEWLGSFHVFAFTLIAGYLFYYLQIENQHYSDFFMFICKKAHRLLVPSYAVGLLWIAPLTYLFMPFTVKDLIRKYVFLYQPSQLWFLGMLFVCFIIAWFLKKIAQEHSSLLVLLCLMAYGIGMVGIHYRLNYFMICSGLMYIPFFEMGYKIRQKYNDLLFRFHPIVLLIIDFIAFAFLFFTSNYLIEISKGIYFIYRFLLNLLGAFSAFSILVQLSSRYSWGKKGCFKYLSERTMIVYLLHQQIIYFFIVWLNGVVHPLIHGIINFVGTMAITLIFSEIVLRVKVLRYLTGN